MVPIAEGTDLGGSLRGPAAFCGVIGFRTSPGLIPRHPDVLGWDSYSVEGPMARSVADTALMLSVMAGPDDRAPGSYPADARAILAAPRRPSVKHWKIAWTPDLGGLVTVDPKIASICADAVAAFKTLGAKTEEASPDMSDVPEVVRLTRAFLMVARHGERVAKHRDVLQPGLVENTEAGLAMTVSDVARGEMMRTALWHRVRHFMETRDLWITPTAAVPPFPIEDPHPMAVGGKPVGKAMQRSFLTYAFSVLGLPAISIPCGFTRAGLPVGLQIVGKRRQEAAVLTAAAALEVARPWADRHPPLQ
jgi:amidase